MNSERIASLSQEIKLIDIRQHQLVFSPVPHYEVEDELIRLKADKEQKLSELESLKPVKVPLKAKLSMYLSMLTI